MLCYEVDGAGVDCACTLGACASDDDSLFEYTLGDDGSVGYSFVVLGIGSALPSCCANSNKAFRTGSPAVNDGAVVDGRLDRIASISAADWRK